MAIAFRATATASATTGSLSLTKPTGTQLGDLMIVFIIALSTSGHPTITPPAQQLGFNGTNWNVLTTLAPGANTTVTAYWKYATGIDVGLVTSYAFTFSGVTMSSSKGAIHSYSGGAAIDSFSALNNTSFSTSIPTTSISANTTSDLLVFFGGVNAGTAITAFTPPSGMTQRDLVANTSALVGLVSADKLLTTAGSVGTITGTISNTNTTEGFLIALQPAQPYDASTQGVTLVGCAQVAVTGTSTTITYPPGIQANDLILLHGVDNTSVTTPTGFTAVVTATDGSSVNHRLFSKVAVGTETGTVTYTVGTSSDISLVMCVWRGVLGSAVYNVLTEAANGSGTTDVPPTQTSVPSGAVTVSASGARGFVSTASATITGTGWAYIIAAQNNFSGFGNLWINWNPTGTGSVTGATTTWNKNYAGKAGISFQLLPDTGNQITVVGSTTGAYNTGTTQSITSPAGNPNDILILIAAGDSSTFNKPSSFTIIGSQANSTTKIAIWAKIETTGTATAYTYTTSSFANSVAIMLRLQHNVATSVGAATNSFYSNFTTDVISGTGNGYIDLQYFVEQPSTVPGQMAINVVGVFGLSGYGAYPTLTIDPGSLETTYTVNSVTTSDTVITLAVITEPRQYAVYGNTTREVQANNANTMCYATVLIQPQYTSALDDSLLANVGIA